MGDPLQETGLPVSRSTSHDVKSLLTPPANALKGECIIGFQAGLLDTVSGYVSMFLYGVISCLFLAGNLFTGRKGESFRSVCDAANVTLRVGGNLLKGGEQEELP